MSITKPLHKEETSIDTETPKVVMLHNDDYNSFTHVIECLISICGKSKHEAEICTMIAHSTGMCVVAEGDEKHLNRIKYKLRAKGLIATIEIT